MPKNRLSSPHLALLVKLLRWALSFGCSPRAAVEILFSGKQGLRPSGILLWRHAYWVLKWRIFVGSRLTSQQDKQFCGLHITIQRLELLSMFINDERTQVAVAV